MKNISIRLDEEDLSRMEALSARFLGVIKPAAVARAAMRLGLDRLEAEGIKALEAPSVQKKSAKK